MITKQKITAIIGDNIKFYAITTLLLVLLLLNITHCNYERNIDKKLDDIESTAEDIESTVDNIESTVDNIELAVGEILYVVE